MSVVRFRPGHHQIKNLGAPFQHQLLISGYRGINISQAEQVGASKPLLAIDNCRGHELKQRTNPTFVSFLCPGRLLAQRTRLHSAAHSGSRGRRAEERAAAIRTENRILERELLFAAARWCVDCARVACRPGLVARLGII